MGSRAVAAHAPPRRRSRWYLRLAGPTTAVAAVFVLAVFAPLVTRYSPLDMDPLTRMSGPSAAHLLGTDGFGRDILSRIAFGARLSLAVSLSSVALGGIAGALFGMVAGYFGGATEMVIMRVMDGLLSFPPILLAVFVITFLGPSDVNVTLVIGLLYTPRFARLARGSTLAIRETEYVQAAQALGATAVRVLRLAILPNVIAPLLVQASLGLGEAILLESGLSFLGLGAPPPAPSWGSMIQEASRFMSLSLWPLIWPAVTISMTVLAFNLLGDGLRERLDPRLRGTM